MLMPFNNLQALGKEKFGKIKNQLMQGIAATEIARMIQMEWGDFQNITEDSLSKQLGRLRAQMVAGAFGKDVAKQLESIQVPTKQTSMNAVAKILGGVTVEVLGRMEELAELQRGRVLRLEKKEALVPTLHLPALDIVVKDYSELLQALQKIRFDLGADEFKGPLTGVRVQSASVNLPDGTLIQKSVYEASEVLERIFDSRGIRTPSSREEQG